jgi:hypothetical protein
MLWFTATLGPFWGLFLHLNIAKLVVTENEITAKIRGFRYAYY